MTTQAGRITIRAGLTKALADGFRSIRIGPVCLLSLLGLLFLLPAPRAEAKDWLALRDGTIIECEVAKEEDLAVYLKFNSGTIRVGREHVALLAREEPNEFVPADDYEKTQFEKGKVKFEGQWITIRKRDQILGKRYKTIKKKIDEIEKHKSWHHAYEIKTKSAIIKSNAPKEILDFYVEQWEAFASYFKKDWKIRLKSGMKRKLPLICIYKDEADYQEFASPPPNALGFFSRDTEELHIYHDRTDMMDTLEVLFHEGTHLLVYYIEPSFIYPIWMNEGMAEYISANTYDGKEYTPGELQGDRLIPLEQKLASNQLMSVEEMINLPQLSFVARGGYPPAWSFTHFMLQHKTYSKKYKEFFLGLPRGKAKLNKDGQILWVSPENLRDAFQRIFKKDMFELQDEWHEHIRTILDNLDGKSFYMKGRVRYFSGDPAGARNDLEKALEMGTDLPECHYLLGMASARTGAVQSGIKSLETAIELDPLNPWYYFGLGTIKTNYVPRGREGGKALMNMALEMAPTNLRLKRNYDHFWSGGKVTEKRAEEEDDDD